MQLKEREIDMVKKFIGSSIKNPDGEKMGFIAGVFTTHKHEKAEYIILGCDHLFGDNTRYFAVPASSEMISVSDKNVNLQIGKDQLMQTKRISLNKCPKPLFDLEPLIYELTDFHRSKHQKKAYHNNAPSD